MYGMEVFRPAATDGGTGIVMFYPVTRDGAMVVCPGPDETQIDPLTLCSVTTYMNEWLFAEYNILYSLMPQFELINSVMVNHILEFRARPPAA